jgi:hypothetical protein
LLSQCSPEQLCVSPGLFSISVELESGKTLAKVIRVRRANRRDSSRLSGLTLDDGSV